MAEDLFGVSAALISYRPSRLVIHFVNTWQGTRIPLNQCLSFACAFIWKARCVHNLTTTSTQSLIAKALICISFACQCGSLLGSYSLLCVQQKGVDVKFLLFFLLSAPLSFLFLFFPPNLQLSVPFQIKLLSRYKFRTELFSLLHQLHVRVFNRIRHIIVTVFS